MIVVTGAAGFIGSWMIKKLNAENFNFIIAVDKFGDPEKENNLKDLKIQERVDRDQFFDWLDMNFELVEFIFHFGARTNTMEMEVEILSKLNTEYSKSIWKKCVDYQIPLIYASSAATYGDGENGFDDNEHGLENLSPLNPYGESKHQFDLWAVGQQKKPYYWCGLKFFNVFGPNEAHKGKMASMVYQINRQVIEEGQVSLFKSYHDEYEDGEQKRDFIHVNEVVNTCYWLMNHRKNSGIYNLGMGRSITFNQIAQVLFDLHQKPPHVNYIEMPDSIKDKYQYDTIASMDKLESIGYKAGTVEYSEEIKNTF